MVFGYDPVDFEIYDLVEEVGIQNSFYSLLEIEQSASTSEVRRAYRKLSLVLHPDKNDSPDADVKFRQLVSVYEILKDAEKRNKYDDVLKNGLPDWRQPIYYYRKVKKMGLAELAVLLLVVLTIGHYIVSWAVYLEKAFELEEIMAPIKKRREKKRAKGKLTQDDIDTSDTVHILETNLGYKKPSLKTLFPILMYHWTVAFVKAVPGWVKDMKDKYEQYKEEKRQMKEDEEQEKTIEVKERPKKKKQPIKLKDASEFENELAAISPLQQASYATDADIIPIDRSNTEWTEDDLSGLARAMAKFPGGIPGRWDKIALEIGRSVSEVTKKVKEMKTSMTSVGAGMLGNASSSSGVTGKRAAFQISDNIITKAIETELNPKPVISVSPDELYMTQDEIPDDYDQGVSYDQQEEDEDMEQYKQVRKRKVKTRPVDQVNSEGAEDSSSKVESKPKDANNSEEHQEEAETVKEAEQKKVTASVDVWSQVQQKCLETALAHVPKNRTDRWAHIARSVPGKSKEECIQRYKLLVEHIKKKKDPDNARDTKKSD
eukprot:gene3334-3823_t